jgi:hypothetical protein
LQVTIESGAERWSLSLDDFDGDRSGRSESQERGNSNERELHDDGKIDLI